MDKVVRKYHLNDSQQEVDERKYWQRQSAEHKLEVLESLRRDAFKLGIYPDEHACRRRLRNVLKVVKLNKKATGRNSDLEDLKKMK